MLQIYDVVRYRIHRMKKKLKDELEDKNSIQEYICPNCGRRYLFLHVFCFYSSSFFIDEFYIFPDGMYPDTMLWMHCG